MYEYTTKTPVSGMGWSEISTAWRPGTLTYYCPGSNKDRKICATDTAQDNAAIRSAGCVRPLHSIWRDARSVSCTTGGGPVDSSGSQTDTPNPGTIWCCPANRPEPLPTTPTGLTQENARRAELQQAAQRGEISSDGSPTTAPKTPAEDEGVVSSDNSYLWVFGVLGVAVFSYIGYKYVTSKTTTDTRVSRRSRLSGRRI
jgi:hypothetical protein